MKKKKEPLTADLLLESRWEITNLIEDIGMIHCHLRTACGFMNDSTSNMDEEHEAALGYVTDAIYRVESAMVRLKQIKADAKQFQRYSK